VHWWAVMVILVRVLEGQQDTLEAYIFRFLLYEFDCARFQPMYWMEMMIFGSKETQTYGFDIG